MGARSAVVAAGILALAGCALPSQHEAPGRPAGVVRIEVVRTEEHLGHSINEGGGHSVWCDGTRARVIGTGEDFVVFWINNEIARLPYRFEEGRRYTVRYSGALGDAVMGYEGKCLHVGSITDVQPIDE